MLKDLLKKTYSYIALGTSLHGCELIVLLLKCVELFAVCFSLDFHPIRKAERTQDNEYEHQSKIS